MKFITFKKQIEVLKKLYDEALLKDKKLEEALGGDTQVMTDWWSSILDGILNSIKSEFNLPEEDETIDWLFYDCICGNEDLSFEKDGVMYKGNIKNIYLSLTGMLDERLGEIVEKETTEYIVPVSPITDINTNEVMLAKTEAKQRTSDIRDNEINNSSSPIDSLGGGDISILNTLEDLNYEDMKVKNTFREKYKKIKMQITAVLSYLRDSKNYKLKDGENISELIVFELNVLLNRAKEYNEIKNFSIYNNENSEYVYCTILIDEEIFKLKISVTNVVNIED